MKKIKKLFTLFFSLRSLSLFLWLWWSKVHYTPHLKSIVQLYICFMFFLLSCSWKEKVVSCISKINSYIYLRWRRASIFWVKHPMFWILKPCASNVLRHQSRAGELFYWPSFNQVIWEGLHAENRAHTWLLVILHGK